MEHTDGLPLLAVVAGVMVFDGKVLIARRLGGEMDGYWELPGGKVERGEVPTESLKRELKEELGVDVEVGDLVGSTRHEIPGKRIQLSAYQVFPQSRDFRLTAHSEVCWVTPDDWGSYRLAPADLPLLERVRELTQLPSAE